MHGTFVDDLGADPESQARKKTDLNVVCLTSLTLMDRSLTNSSNSYWSSLAPTNFFNDVLYSATVPSKHKQPETTYGEKMETQPYQTISVSSLRIR